MPYDLYELRAFLAVVQHGSIGQAAERLNLSQPALSRIIKRLEADVGEPLFERHSAGMRTTLYGKALLPHAQLLHQEELLARSELDRLRGLATGVLRVGVASGACAVFIHKAIGSFLEKWPGIAIEAMEGIWDDIAHALSNYQIDLVLAPEVPETEAIVEVKNCSWHETINPVVGADHPLRHQAQLRMEDLLDQRWCLIPRNTEPHKRFLSLFEKQGLPAPQCSLSSSSIPLLKSLVAHCGFITWLTAPMYGAEMQADLIHELNVPGLNHARSFAAYHRRIGVLPRPALQFLDEVRQLARERDGPAQPG